MIYRCPKGHTFVIPKRVFVKGKVRFVCPVCGCNIPRLEERDADNRNRS